MRKDIFYDHQDRKSAETLLSPRIPKPSKRGALRMDELMRSNRELKHFALVAAHDLQEPLRTVYSYIQLLNKNYRGKLDDKADRIISSVLGNTESMQKLIQGLLEYSQNGLGNTKFKEVDCSIPLSRAIENLKVKIEENSAKIKYGCCPVIKGDEIQLTQLFQNLINNAIKFRKKEVVPYVRITMREQNDHWYFVIQDNGIGFDPVEARNIFDLFKRLHSQEEYAGRGIGLALCKRIVESHRGKIWIESEVGKGTTVCFTIRKN